MGLPVFCYDANGIPTMDRNKDLNLFQVAIRAKYYFSITEVTKEATKQNHRTRPLTGDLDENHANKRMMNGKYLSLGEAARNQLRDKYSNTTLWDLKADKHVQRTVLEKKVTKRLVHTDFPRPQQPWKLLHQIAHALNGLAANSKFGGII